MAEMPKEFTRVLFIARDAAGMHEVCDIWEIDFGPSEAMAQFKNWWRGGEATHFTIVRGYRYADGTVIFPFQPAVPRTDNITPIGRAFAR